jgi:hypothetical protein
MERSFANLHLFLFICFFVMHVIFYPLLTINYHLCNPIFHGNGQRRCHTPNHQSPWEVSVDPVYNTQVANLVAPAPPYP